MSLMNIQMEVLCFKKGKQKTSINSKKGVLEYRKVIEWVSGHRQRQGLGTSEGADTGQLIEEF